MKLYLWEEADTGTRRISTSKTELMTHFNKRLTEGHPAKVFEYDIDLPSPLKLFMDMLNTDKGVIPAQYVTSMGEVASADWDGDHMVVSMTKQKVVRPATSPHTAPKDGGEHHQGEG